MKKKISIFTLLLLTIVAFGQSNNYDRGFENGYKEGYCYNKPGCISPVPPLSPIPLIGESYDSYKDGYNRGFKRGLEDQESNKTKSDSKVNNDYKRRPFPQSEYIEPDWDFLIKAGATMQARYDQNKDYRDKLIDWIFALKKENYDNEFLSAMDRYYKELRNMDGQNFIILGDKLDFIKQNIKEEIDKFNTRAKEAPKKLWDSGNENMKNMNYTQAIIDFTNLIRLSPDFDYVYRNRGMSYQYLGKYSQALTDLNKYIEMKNDDPLAYSSRGWIKNNLNDNMGALADFNKQIELEPNSAYAYYNRGFIKSELHDEYGAIKDYTKAIELKPDFSTAWNNRGWSKYVLKQYYEALKDFNKAIEVDPSDWAAYDSRQEVKFMLNDFKGCIEDCNKAISLNPKVENSYFYRGRAYYKLGNKTKACEDWSLAGELGKSEAYDFIKKYCN